MFKRVLFVLLAAALTACGGGGGGGDSPGGNLPGSVISPGTPAANPAATFSPGKVAASFEAGTSKAITVQARILRPQDFYNAGNVYAYVIDTTGVIEAKVQFLAMSETVYSLTLYTTPSLASGVYKGDFTVKLCRDSACTSQFPGSPMALPFEINVMPRLVPITVSSSAALEAVARLGSTAVTETNISVTTQADWKAVSSNAWIELSKTAGSGNASIGVKLNPAGLPAGTYRGSVAINAGNDPAKILAATMTVQAAPAFAISGSTIVFDAINGAPIPPRAISVDMLDKLASSWTVASDVSWLSVSPASGVTPASMTLSPNPANAKLASGRHETTLTLNSPGATPAKLTVRLQLTEAKLSVTDDSVSLGGSSGRDLTPARVYISLNTTGTAWPWSVANKPDWLDVQGGSPKVGPSGTSLQIKALPGAPSGTTTTVVKLQAFVNGDVIEKALTVTLNSDRRILQAAQNSIALSATAQLTRRSHSVKIGTNFPDATPWTASSDRSWLSVTPAGVAGNLLTVNANPAALPDNQLSYATVTISGGANVTPDTVRVALWKSSTGLQSKLSVNQAYTDLLADPLRPYVYAHSKGGSLDVYHVHTGARLATIPGLGGALGDMTINAAGDTLYAIDTSGKAVVALHLDTFAKGATWPLATAPGPLTRVLAIRPNASNIVITNDSQAWLQDGSAISNKLPAGEYVASGDGKLIHFQTNYGNETTGSGMLSYRLDYMAGGASGLSATLVASYPYSARFGAIAMGADSSRFYVAGEGSDSRCARVSGDNIAAIGRLTGRPPAASGAIPNNVAAGVDGRVYCGYRGTNGSADILAFKADDSFVNSFRFAALGADLLQGQLVVSSDGLVLVGLSNDGKLMLLPLGQ